MHSDFRLRRLIFFAKRKEFTFLFKNAVFTKKRISISFLQTIFSKKKQQPFFSKILLFTKQNTSLFIFFAKRMSN